MFRRLARSMASIMRVPRAPAAPLLALVVTLAACTGSATESTESSATTSAPSPAEPQESAASAPPAATVRDGEVWLAYQWTAPAGDGIFLVRPDGRDKHQFVPDMAGSEWHPDWSPDGARLAFVRVTPELTTELWVADADGTDAELLYTCELPCNEIHYPDWSPDGASIYFSQSANVPEGEVIPRTFSIIRVDVDEATAATVYGREDGVEAWQARISPDGTTLVFAAGSEELGAAIFTMPVDGGEPFQVTAWELLAAHPDWTPDGRIIFHTHDLAIFPSLGEAANLFMVDADGGNLEQLTQFEEPGQRVAQSRVSPDGTGATFVQVEGPGMGSRRLAFLAFGETEPTWLPTDPLNGTHPHLRPVP